MSRSRRMLTVFGTLVALVAAIQLVPYGRDHSSPPDGARPAWDSPGTEAVARRACFDCHSNETRWPWYSSFAPVSWRLQTHVREGREALNFSAFDPRNKDMADAAGEAGETIAKGEMPPADYLLMHPEARLNAQEKRALIAGFESTFAAFVESDEGRGERRGEHRGGRESDGD